jgi:hypothetical protein
VTVDLPRDVEWRGSGRSLGPFAYFEERRGILMEARSKGQPSKPVVFTANRLRDGRVVWFASDDRWTESLAEAQIFDGEAVARGRALAEAWAARQIVVGPYDIEVDPTSDGPVPVKIRERIRASGPTTGPDVVRPPAAAEAAE